MIDALPLLLSDEGYQISRSVRLRSSASAYFSRTLTTPTNNKIWTWSAWVKRGRASGTSASALTLFATGSGSTDAGSTVLHFDNERLVLTGYNTVWLISNAVYRDPSAWYHIVVAWDNSNATASNRIKIYVNGLEISYATDNRASLSTTSTYGINQAVLHTLGAWSWNSGTFAQPEYYDGYLTEVNFIDGQALTPASFGETNPVTGVWQPKRYTGTYGTNGFYLNFSDPSAATAAAIGKDYSGNGNNWTPNNISVTAGATYDSMLDVPTQWADGGNGRGNYCVWNAAAQSTVFNGTVTRSNGNLTSTDGGTTYGLASFGTIGVTTGKWYWETTLTSAGGTFGTIGVIDLNSPIAAPSTHTGILYAQGGNKSSGSAVFTGSGSTAYGATYTTGDIIGIALDLDAGEITFYKNGVSQGVAYAGISGNYTPAVGDGQNSTSYTFDLNCGQRPFAYTPPSGFKALNTLNLPTPTILKGNQFFDATIWTGDGTGNRAITNSGSMQPDLVWLKIRNQAFFHRLTDSVRGATKELYSNATDAEFTQSQGLLSFDAGGFTVGTSTSYNGSGNTYVGWQWKEGATQGFDIVTYTAPAAGVQSTFAHNLGVAPRMIITKSRTDGTFNWAVYHASVCDTTSKFLRLNTTDALATFSTIWGASLPTSSVFGITGDGAVKAGTSSIAYLFAAVSGFSAFGSYTGNGSADGPFVFCGFRPRWVMVKRTDVAEGWQILDTARNTVNVVNSFLEANQSNAEGTSTARDTDYTANGFKVRNTSAAMNASGGTYIFAAFCENPFKNALAR